MQNPGFPENDLTFESLPQIYVRGDHGKDPQAHGMGLDSKLVILQTNGLRKLLMQELTGFLIVLY